MDAEPPLPPQSCQRAWEGGAVKGWETPDDQRDSRPETRLGDLGLGARGLSEFSCALGERAQGRPMAGISGRDPMRVSGICYLLGSLLLGLLSPGAVAFNLDVMGALRKEGEPESLFGFSVALHRQLQPRPQSW